MQRNHYEYIFAVFNSTFNFDYGFDGWRQDPADDGDWLREYGSTSSYDTGPSEDATGDRYGIFQFYLSLSSISFFLAACSIRVFQGGN